MSQTERAFEIAQRAIEQKIWTEKTAFRFVTTAETMTHAQFNEWANQARKEN